MSPRPDWTSIEYSRLHNPRRRTRRYTYAGCKNPQRQPKPRRPGALPVGPLKNLDLDMRVTADELLTAGQSITDARVLLRVQDGIANIDYIRGVLHQGQLDTRLA